MPKVYSKRKKVFGVGVNDADYPVQITVDGKRVWCPYYRVWHNMLKRCSPIGHRERPSYTGCSVCDEWHRFSIFKSWMQSKVWEGRQLDKDLLGNGLLYSPDTCCFISSSINTLLQDSRQKDSDLPRGVHLHQGRYRAEFANKKLGMFGTPNEAHKAWKLAKARRLSEKITNEFDFRARSAILQVIIQLTGDLP